MLPISTITSTSIDTLTVNPLTGTVRVRFQSYWTRRPYVLKASRRAIAMMLLRPPVSVGQWVNRHCLQRHLSVTV